MDLDPFEPVGIAASTMRFLDVFLLHCLLQDSPPDTPQEIAELGRNQHHTAAHGREPGLTLERGGRKVLLADWAGEVLADCTLIAQALDDAHGVGDYSAALASARATLARPQTLPSARVLATIEQDFDRRYTAFIRAQAEQTRNRMLALPWTAEQQAAFEAMARDSVARQKALEAADSVDFETFRQHYVAEEHLHV